MVKLEVSRDEDDEIQFNTLKDQLLLRLTDLVKINSQKTRDMIARFQKNAEEEVISKLGMYPDLQLEYVQNILKKEREEGNKPDKDMLLLHINLLCKLQQNLIIEELRANEYPLDLILEITRSAKLEHITAYILERLGSVQEAVQIHL
jgi:hypothetical protein